MKFSSETLFNIWLVMGGIIIGLLLSGLTIFFE